MTNVPATPEVAQLPTMPGCGEPAAKRLEIYRSGHGRTFAELAGTVNVCRNHVDAVAPALGDNFLLLPLDDDVSERPCGSGMDFAGDRPEPLAARCRAAYPDYGRVHDVDRAHADALAVEEPKPAPAMVEAAGQAAVLRIARANMLREISRLCYAVDSEALPAPRAVRFDKFTHAAQLDFDTEDEAIAWAARLGAEQGTLRSARHFALVGATGYHAIVVWRGVCVDLVSVATVEIEPAVGAAPAAEVQAEVDALPVPPEHYQVGGSVGGPGENSVECACGLVFDGFDTHAGAMAFLDRHIADPEPASLAGGAS
ncbi:hypothetical protein GA0070622_1226 [Micromonospora sediminicola]|uniref:Uncharacterized protein n=1 Tax=Micromonospora sediminicola TaxID=946078 RepID=A0A1A9B5B5_9ACTN|nr:hypothetical protein [Micromonospora sediminicola]SBT64256.1 hypothetical protein GA0070622_1226 [Micromonospora sediminicola]